MGVAPTNVLNDKVRFLTDEFLDKYTNQNPPFTELGEFVYYRTYSRWLDDKKRRETWLETCRRSVEYNISLEYRHRLKKGLPIDMDELRRQAEDLFDRQFHLKGFLSGRTLWVGGTVVAERYPLANFNCAFTEIRRFKDFTELFYLLMVGAGVGFRATQDTIKDIEPYRVDVQLEQEPYNPVPKEQRQDYTSTEEFERDGVRYLRVIVGDSKEGWVGALLEYFNGRISGKYDVIRINYDNVRRKGERLKTFGGTASGHESLQIMFTKIDKILNREGGKLSSVGVLDICNIIGENVVAGGVRRTSEIGLCDEDDTEFINAKNGIYYQDEQGNWCKNEEIGHREMSNNTILFYKKPTRERLRQIFQSIKISGEPGFYNMEAVARRVKAHSEKYGMPYKERKGTNPCGEILLDSKQTCNLTTNNVLAYVKDGKLDEEDLINGFRATARAGYRMTLVDLELPDWDRVQKRDRLTGVSLTGWQDMVEATGMSRDEQRALLRKLHQAVREEVDKMAEALGTERSYLSTTVKPEGTISKLPTVSSGLHFSHAPYYIRRVRITEADALCQMAKALGWKMNRVNHNTMAIEFPIKSEQKRTIYDVPAVEQLENYKMFMEEYVEHNASVTVSVQDHEWDDVEQWVWDNWDSIIGITFIALGTQYYDNMPEERISQEEYETRKAEMEQKPFNPDILNFFEDGKDKELDNDGCENGVCPVR